MAQFQEEYGRVLQLLQSFSFCPENLPAAAAAVAATGAAVSPSKKTLEKHSSKKQLQGPVSSILCRIWFGIPKVFRVREGQSRRPS